MTNMIELQALVALRHACTTGDARRQRLRAGVSLTEAAAACGITPATLSRWETGKRKPRGDAALRYAQILAHLNHPAAA